MASNYSFFRIFKKYNQLIGFVAVTLCVCAGEYMCNIRVLEGIDSRLRKSLREVFDLPILSPIANDLVSEHLVPFFRLPSPACHPRSVPAQRGF